MTQLALLAIRALLASARSDYTVRVHSTTEHALREEKFDSRSREKGECLHLARGFRTTSLNGCVTRKTS